MTDSEARKIIRKTFIDTYSYDMYAEWFKEDIEFIQYTIEEDAGVYSLGYVVASNYEEIKRILSQEGNQGYSEWHSKDIDLVGWNNLLEDETQLQVSDLVRKDMSKVNTLLTMLGECTVKMTKDGMTIT